jgi:glycerol-3-phosphate acyltransferase PlsY
MSWFIIILSYILGSIPTSYIFGRFTTGCDIRAVGDENAGAANAYRELGPRTGIIVGVIDAAKGAAVILIAQAANMPQFVVLIAGVAAVAGHNWPIFLGFRGGRGVSTTLGILYVLVTIPMLVLTLPTLLILILKRNVTPSMAFLFIALPFVDLFFKVPPCLLSTVLPFRRWSGLPPSFAPVPEL